MIYIKEAHPSDGWEVPNNEREGISIADPKTYAARRDVAEKACTALNLKLPCVVDTIDDAVNKAYAAWPDRLYVVDIGGKIAVAGGQGPAGFAPALRAAKTWLERLRPAASPTGQSR